MNDKLNTPFIWSVIWKLAIILFFSWLSRFDALAQNENPKPFRHRVGQSAPESNIFRIKGDFTIIGNSNLQLLNHTDTAHNSFAETIYVDIDNDLETFNSSSARLVFSEENNADPNCSEIRYAGLYWSGRTVLETDLTFDVTRYITPGQTIHFNNEEFSFGYYDKLANTSLNLSIYEYIDENEKPTIQYIVSDSESDFFLLINFENEEGKEVNYSFNAYEYENVENLEVTTKDGISTATFTPIEYEHNGLKLSFGKLTKKDTYQGPDGTTLYDALLHITFNGSYTPLLPHTVSFDKRKLKLKGPNATTYTEITAEGNAILFPSDELADIYVGYSDITDYVKTHGLGDYTVADMALLEGYSDNIGYYGNWGIIVVYQNSKMNWRDITIFDGYSFVQSLDGNEHTGEIEISGFGTVNSGPVELKLGLMAGEGDQPTGGDFLEIIDQKGEWLRLKHPMNTTDNFFNSTIYTPVKNASNEPIPTPRFPNLKNNIGADIVQWDIDNINNSIIGNNQTNTKFRFGTRQDLYAIYALAFSVLSYIPEIQVLHQPVSINGSPLPLDPTLEPGQEITYSTQIRNLGSEEVTGTKITIPLPFTATFVSAATIPSDFGQVTFDPNLGINGTIIWDIGDLPLKQNESEIIATLNYTIRVTEDCSILSIASCEANVSMDGFVSGTGKLSENSFSNLPFVYEIKEGNCEGEEIYTPLEIPIIKREEFAALHCQDFKELQGLKNVILPNFCQGDAPIDLIEFIEPSDPDFNVYIFTQETGGTALNSYFVNTYNIGEETIWIAQGLDVNCTGLRTPVKFEVIAKAPEIIDLMDREICPDANDINFHVFPNSGYNLIYYADNDPNSQPLSTKPTIDITKIGKSSIWVSQSRDGECESTRMEASATVRDCSLYTQINMKVTPSTASYSYVGQVLTFELQIINSGDVDLTDVKVKDFLVNTSWFIPYMSIGEVVTYTYSYTVTEDDMQIEFLRNIIEAYGESQVGQTAMGMNVFTYRVENEVPEYTIFTIDETCGPQNQEQSGLIFEFEQNSFTGSIEVNSNNGFNEAYYFSNTSNQTINLPSGIYEITLITENGIRVKNPSTFTINEPGSVEFLVEENIYTCTSYDFFPSSTENLTYEVIDPSGKIIQLNSNGKFTLNQAGTHKVIGKDPNEIKCQIEKSFVLEIPNIANLSIEMDSFCQNDHLTNIRLIDSNQSFKINWFRQLENDLIPLDEFDDLTDIQVTETGNYQVTSTNLEGCVVGKRVFEVIRTTNIGPEISSFYTICPTKVGSQSITISNQFKDHIWYLNEEEISNEAILFPTENGYYSLVVTDMTGCVFSVDFEVEIKCEPTLIYSNAIRPGKEGHGLMIVTDNLIESVEVQVFNRWGELIYTCQDAQPKNGKPSICFWDGMIYGNRAITGNYSVIIQYTVKGEAATHKILDMVMVVD